MRDERPASPTLGDRGSQRVSEVRREKRRKRGERGGKNKKEALTLYFPSLRWKILLLILLINLLLAFTPLLLF